MRQQTQAPSISRLPSTVETTMQKILHALHSITVELER
jgi:hypothetical protein